MNQQALKSILSYDEKTGHFRWLINASSSARIGTIAGYRNTIGYWQIKINRKMYKAHRLAWLYCYGEWPTQIDHINCIRDDNRLLNLREATPSQNGANRLVQKNNISGRKGVHWHKYRKRWYTSIYENGKRKHLGAFSSVEEAYSTYCSAAAKIYGKFANFGAIMIAIMAVLLFTMAPSQAKHYRHHYQRYNHIIYGEEHEHIVSHPAGCPGRAFCGCGVSVKVFGRPVRNLFLASNWFKFPRTSPSAGMVAVRNHHVMFIEAMDGNGNATVYDPNSGGHQTRVHTRSLAGYTVVNPHGSAMANNERQSRSFSARRHHRYHRHYASMEYIPPDRMDIH